jgi:hypothetical protein
MKVFLALLLVVLLLLLALPVAMGMDMSDGPCPACVATGSAALGLCLGILAAFALGFGAARNGSLSERRRSGATTALAAVFRPPQPLYPSGIQLAGRLRPNRPIACEQA